MSGADLWWGISREQPAKPIDWPEVGRFAWLFLNCVRVLDGGNYVPWPDWSRATAPPPIAMPTTVAEAATLLGIRVDATPDQVRAALRDKMSNGAHPDHGGDAEIAKQLIAARNLLLEYARGRS